MQSITIFLNITKVADFRRKDADVSRAQGLCHLICVSFGSSFGKAEPHQVSSLQNICERF